MKVVLDTSVVVASVYSPRLIAQSAARKLFDLMAREALEVFTCDIQLGEILRVVSTDPKLSKANPPYLEARMREFQQHSTVVPMQEIQRHRENMQFPPGDYIGKVGENDVYLVALAAACKARYLISFDGPLIEAFKVSSLGLNFSIVKPAEFLHIERKMFP